VNEQGKVNRLSRLIVTLIVTLQVPVIAPPPEFEDNRIFNIYVILFALGSRNLEGQKAILKQL